MKLPYIPVFVNDYLADTTRLKATANGAYWFLLLEYWRLRGPLPSDDQWLMDTARVTEREWKNVRSQVLGFFVVDDGRLVHSRMEKELARAKYKSEKAEESARTRWDQEHANA
jgi:uncharacterized protein YdaU (DUF1376 family)